MLEKSKEIRQAAKDFLERKKILNLLSQYGEVFFTGSFATDLMVWPDLDIQILLPENSNKIDIFTELAKNFLLDSDLKKLQIINFTPGKKAGMPLGLYLGLDYNDLDFTWKIDLWALEKEFFDKDRLFTEKILSQITPELRKLIIKIKFSLLSEGKRVPQSYSYKLYQAIFDYNLTNEEEILSFIQKV